MIRFYLDTDDDFEVGHGLDISEEIIDWESRRRADRISRAETDGMLGFKVRRGRASPDWWRVGRLIEARVDDFVFFRGFVLDAASIGKGMTRVRALTWLQYLRWRGRTPAVVGLAVIDAVREVINAAADGFPGASHPSARLIEQVFGGIRPRRLYWRLSDAPLYWRTRDNPLYWRVGPAPEPDAYHYGRVGLTDTVGDTTLVGPPQPAVAGASSGIVDRLTAVEYAIENFEYGLYEDEIAALAAGELGWIFSGGGNDIDSVGRVASAAPAGRPMPVTTAIYGRYGYEWQVAADAVGQVVGRQPDVQESQGLLYRQENVAAPAGVSSWNVALRDRGRPAEATDDLTADWPMTDGVSVGVSAAFGDLLIEVFNETGAPVVIDWIEVSGTSRVYQGGVYDSRVTGRFGGLSVALRAVFGGAAGLTEALDYWSAVLGEGGIELASVTLDGRRFASAWSGQIGGLLDSDALRREGIRDGATRYWIVGVRGRGEPKAIEVTYELMRYEAGS